MSNLKDRKTQAIILNRVNRLRLGNFGDCRCLGQEIYELRIHYGPGYRIYFGDINDEIIILLLGGAKKSQTQDIKIAKTYWQNFKNCDL